MPKFYDMKKVFVFALLGALVLGSCSKKETSSEESNMMLAEPEVETGDSVVVEEVDVVEVPVADSVTVVVDSTAAN